MLVGLKSLAHFYEGLRYSLVPRLSPDKYIERWGVHAILVNNTAKKSNLHQIIGYSDEKQYVLQEKYCC